jgi:hypothetical protein
MKTFTSAMCFATFTSANPPPMPNAYSMTLSWTDLRTPVPTKYEHNRWYDLTNQLYRDDTIQNGDATEVIIERPSLDQRKYDWDKVRGLCTNSTFQAKIDGFVPVFEGMTEISEMVDGIKATKYTKNLLQYNVSVWFSKGDPKVADNTPLQVYNSYDAETKTHQYGLTKITKFNPTVDPAIFKLSEQCSTGAVTPAPTPVVPTPSPKDQPHWLRDWSKSTCACKEVTWVGDFQTEAECMKVECPP